MGALLELVCVGLFSAAFWTLWTVVQRVFGKSHLDNIPGPRSQSFATGNLGQYLARNGWAYQQWLHNEYGPVVKLNGMFGTKVLYVYDPVALSNIVVKDQYTYEEPQEFLHTMHLMLGDGLLATIGEQHRKQRKMLNPVFSINHMRHMTPIFYEISRKLREAIGRRIKGGQEEMDILDWMARTALEVVGQAGLGCSFDPLINDSADQYGQAIKAIAPTIGPLRLARMLLPLVMNIGSPKLRGWLFRLIPNKSIQRACEISDLLDEHSQRIFNEKKEAMEKGDNAVLHQIGEGKDILSKLSKPPIQVSYVRDIGKQRLIVQANMTASEEDRLPDKELLGQMSTFIFAGMETTSGALAHILQLLSENPDVQHKLRAELLEAYGDADEIPYDQLVELPYLDAVCRETMRLCVFLPFLFREARKDIVMPLSAPLRGVDGTLMHEILVPKDTKVLLGLHACNCNPALWGLDAAEWKPERWLAPLPETLTDAHIPGVYSHLMSFLGGGRACIGFKFSQLEMKVVLATLLSSFTFAPSQRKIVWNVGGIQYPTVGLSSAKAEVPMKIGFVKTT
ncbi:uncharacterized protein FIBRA_00493 [Fibroporia radiculosa]|uniref:Cytochrome P450 n=1 Tax=Fibroporia radiculosa TaxID=599839 RepID=J4GHW8_9APHY|nr:uncharacterized protein FIBRA_00493 [Fibroporia radiculosa]CCL98495.1 predicted protein [Fibroporia radiculosa]